MLVMEKPLRWAGLVLIQLFLFMSVTTLAQNEAPSRKVKLTQPQMKDMAIEQTKVLEHAIQEVIRAGKENRNVDGFIESAVSTHFREGATMQTCTTRDDGQCVPNPPISYTTYFKRLYRLARKCQNMSISFSWIEVVEIKDGFRCKVNYGQDTKICGYEDFTNKELIIYFDRDADNNIIPLIGNAKVEPK